MKYFEARKARIEIIPMIDIMFFLLVFFIMITAHDSECRLAHAVANEQHDAVFAAAEGDRHACH